MIFQVPTDFFTPQSPIEAQGDERALWEQFPFDDFPGSFEAYNQKLEQLTYRDAQSGEVRTWTPKMRVLWNDLLSNPNNYQTRARSYQDLVFVAGRCHLHDNHYTNVIASLFPGWQIGAPISHRLGVSTILLLDTEKLAKTPICP